MAIPGSALIANARRVLVLIVASATLARAQSRRPLDSAAVSDIARLLLFEDVRRFDSVELRHALDAKHPEVRRRAALAVSAHQ